jgi:hypothetical protein
MKVNIGAWEEEDSGGLAGPISSSNGRLTLGRPDGNAQPKTIPTIKDRFLDVHSPWRLWTMPRTLGIPGSWPQPVPLLSRQLFRYQTNTLGDGPHAGGSTQASHATLRTLSLRCAQTRSQPQTDPFGQSRHVPIHHVLYCAMASAPTCLTASSLACHDDNRHLLLQLVNTGYR